MAAQSKDLAVVSYSHWDAGTTHWDNGESVWDATFRPPASGYRSNSSVRSWLQIVRDADKDFDRESTRPIAYEFSNGRKFRQRPYA